MNTSVKKEKSSISVGMTCQDAVDALLAEGMWFGPKINSEGTITMRNNDCMYCLTSPDGEVISGWRKYVGNVLVASG